MGKIGEGWVLFLILLMATQSLSVLAIISVSAQITNDNNIPKPSVPQFTVNVVNASEVPANYWVNPVMNQNMAVLSVYNSTYVIELRIKNQHFSSYIYNDGTSNQNISLFYNVRMKEPFAQNWTVFYDAGLRFPYASNSEYSVLLFPIAEVPVGGGNNTIVPVILEYYWLAQEYGATGPVTSGGQVDFQVEAMIGFVSSLSVTTPFNTEHFVGEISDWSSTQGITIPSSPHSTSPSPTVPEFSWLVILPLFLFMFSIAVTLRHRKTVILSK